MHRFTAPLQSASLFMRRTQAYIFKEVECKTFCAVKKYVYTRTFSVVY